MKIYEYRIAFAEGGSGGVAGYKGSAKRINDKYNVKGNDCFSDCFPFLALLPITYKCGSDSKPIFLYGG